MIFGTAVTLDDGWFFLGGTIVIVSWICLFCWGACHRDIGRLNRGWLDRADARIKEESEENSRLRARVAKLEAFLSKVETFWPEDE